MKTSSPLHIRLAAVVLGWCAFMLNAGAQVPGLLNYQGKVSIGTTPFTGTGQFKFALVNATGTATFWSNDGSSTEGAAPTAAVSLPVVNGLYFVQLGDTTLANMVTLPHAVFQNADVRLRVWFNDGAHGFEQITPDQRIAAVGYAMMAGAVQDGAITSSMIAAGAVGSDQLAAGAVQSANIATGAVGSTQIAAGAVQSANIAAGAVGTDQIADYAVAGEKLWFNYENGTAEDGTITSLGTIGLGFTHVFNRSFSKSPTVTKKAGNWTINPAQPSQFTASFIQNFLELVNGTAAGHHDLAVVGGNPAISYNDNSNSLCYKRASNADGTSWGSVITIATGSGGLGYGQRSSMAVVNGNPAIVFDNPNDDQLMFVRASSATGTGTWSAPQVVRTGGKNGSLAIVQGRPAIAYRVNNGTVLCYTRAVDASGTSWGPDITLDSNIDPNSPLSLAIVDGRPAIAYHSTNEGLRFIRASDSTGDSGFPWSTPISIGQMGGLGVSLTTIDGNPAISYGGATGLNFVRSSSPDGASGTWENLVTAAPDSTILWVTLRELNGRPVICYYDAQRVKYVTAKDAQGSRWYPPGNFGSAFGVGGSQRPKMEIVNGRPAISSVNLTDGDLRYFRIPEMEWTAGDGTAVNLIAASVADGAVGSAQIAAGAVGTAQIAPGAITATQMANPLSAGSVSLSTGDYDFGVATYDVSFPTAFDQLPIITQTVTSSDSETPLTALWTHSSSKTAFKGRLDAGRPTASRVVNLDPTITSVGPAGMDACVISGTKCMAYFFPNSSQFLFTRSLNDSGTSWSTAQRVDIRLSSEQDDNDPIVITAISLIQNGTIPEVFVGVVDKTGNGMRSQVRYIFGNLSGSPWNGTTRMADVNYNQTFRYITSVKAFKANGKLEFLAYARTNNGFDILHARNIDASTPGSGGWRYWSALTGTAPTIPITQDPPDPPAFSSCLLSDGMPAILYQSETGALRFFRATTLDDSVLGPVYSYSFMIPDVATGAAPFAEMALVDDEPAVVYVDEASDDLHYRRSNGGTTWSAPVELDGSSSPIRNLSFKYMPSGPGISYPQIAYVMGGRLHYIRANDRTGTTWRPPVVIDSEVNYDSSGYAGSPTLIQSPGVTPQLYYFKGDLSDIYFMTEAFSYPSTTVNWIAIEP
jgi:hypothetical protein